MAQTAGNTKGSGEEKSSTVLIVYNMGVVAQIGSMHACYIMRLQEAKTKREAKDG